MPLALSLPSLPAQPSPTQASTGEGRSAGAGPAAALLRASSIGEGPPCNPRPRTRTLTPLRSANVPRSARAGTGPTIAPPTRQLRHLRRRHPCTTPGFKSYTVISAVRTDLS